MIRIVKPLGRKNVTIRKTERRIELPNGGSIEFWSTEPAQAGEEESEVARGRKYKRIVYDEAARARRLRADWERAIRPTLSDYRGDAWFPSTPKGHNYFHRLWSRGQDGEDREWSSWQMPTSSNPFIHADEIEAARRDLPEDAFSQEYLAEFLADAANPFGITHIRACLIEFDPAEPSVWGVDLAKSTDWTVAVGLNERGRVVAFQRWRADWRNTAARLGGMIKDSPALVDSTGVGDPIVEMLQAKCPWVEGFKFTRQSKQQIMEGLALGIQRHELGLLPGVMQNELEQFEYEYTPTGVRYTAPEGCHDDTVDALALAWRCLSSRPAALAIDVDGTDTSRAERAWDDPYLDDDDDIWTPL